MSIEEKNVTVISNKFFKGEFRGEKYAYSKFEDIGAKEAHFIDCDFSFSYFNRCYFHKVTFENCRFIGCLFNQCTIRTSHFKVCDFKYSRFFQTVLPDEEILANLPEWPNVRLELLQNLRLNAQNTGNTKGIRIFLIEELDARRDYYLKMAKGKESYFKEKYKGLYNRIRGYWKYLTLWLDKYTWGHGERPYFLFLSITLSILVSWIMILFGNSHKIIIDNRISYSYMYNVFMGITGFFLGINIIPEAPWVVKIFIGVAKIFFMGVLITVLLRVLSKR